MEYADGVVCIDNEALYNYNLNVWKNQNPTVNDINHLACRTLNLITSPLRFNSEVNSDMRRLINNLVPHPRLHFFM